MPATCPSLRVRLYVSSTHCHIVTSSYCRIVIVVLLYRRIVALLLSCCHIVALSRCCRVATSSHCRIVIVVLPYYRIVILSYCRIATLLTHFARVPFCLCAILPCAILPVCHFARVLFCCPCAILPVCYFVARVLFCPCAILLPVCHFARVPKCILPVCQDYFARVPTAILLVHNNSQFNFIKITLSKS